MPKITGEGTSEKYLHVLRGIKEPILLPFLRLFTALGIRADHITWLGYLLAVAAVPLRDVGWLLVLAVADLAVDLLDGSLARFQRTNDAAGTIFDAAHDALFVMASTYALTAMGIVSFEAAYLYGTAYGLMAVLVLVRESLGNQARIMVRPRLYVFAALALLLFTRIDIVSPVMLTGGILLAIHDAFSLRAILRSLRKKA
ncbi:MAG TPA: CDP-alcohol phosphatidyltransferase family protein [Candidatus Peribacteria bacterium]|nr:CDP-alcohol phosphatidyltransferase family protein [Candidatus Peribacteria bacterium]